MRPPGSGLKDITMQRTKITLHHVDLIDKPPQKRLGQQKETQREKWQKQRASQRAKLTSQGKHKINEKRRKKYAEKEEREAQAEAKADESDNCATPPRERQDPTCSSEDFKKACYF